jgi:twinkle protein
MNMHVGTAGTAAIRGLSDDGIAFAKGRGISRATLEQLGAASGMVKFPSLQKRSPALFFRYGTDWKARAIPDKAFVTNPGAKLSFWNLDRVLRANSETVFITEGEFDALALVEAGIPAEQVLSVPNGAGTTADGAGYVDDALAVGLNRVQRFVWCGDADDAGLSLRDQMVRRLGAA